MRIFFSLMIVSSILICQDWANLNRYHSENEKLLRLKMKTYSKFDQRTPTHGNWQPTGAAGGAFISPGAVAANSRSDRGKV